MRFKRVKPSLKTGGVGWNIGENRRKIRRKSGEKRESRRLTIES